MESNAETWGPLVGQHVGITAGNPTMPARVLTGILVAVGAWPAAYIVVHLDDTDRDYILMLAHVGRVWAL